MISSRKQSNVEKALEKLQKEYGIEKVRGLVCHVSKKDDRSNLIKEVLLFMNIYIYFKNITLF